MEEKNKQRHNNDLLLLLALFVIALLVFLIFKFTGKQGDYAEVTVGSKVVGRYSLSENTVVDISEKSGQLNRLEIKNGSAKIVSANCPDGICKAHRQINKTNETIICLPHKTVVKIVSGKIKEVDIIG